jgi:NAD(P)-dependent dehydrogenase (short-subunit alcohol dehydrogenase family)
MARQLAVVTGATGGIGLHIARGLAASGRDVVLIGRSRAKAEAACGEVARAASGGARVSVELADLASIAAVTQLAARLVAQFPAIALLVNNAGVMTTTKTLSADGIELDLAVNHVAPFLLTWHLLPVLRRTGGARVVNVNSQNHEKARLTPADLSAEAPFRAMQTYGKSKLANMAVTVEFAARVPPAEATINAVHPGVVATHLVRGGLMGLAWSLMKPIQLSPERGAQTPLWAATAAELAGVSGHYYKKCAPAAMSPQAQEQGVREMVWTRTLELVGMQGAVLVSP